MMEWKEYLFVILEKLGENDLFAIINKCLVDVRVYELLDLNKLRRIGRVTETRVNS